MIQDKWEGDVGDYVDAIAHDTKFGGTKETIKYPKRLLDRK